jgi:hypothetical protein
MKLMNMQIWGSDESVRRPMFGSDSRGKSMVQQRSIVVTIRPVSMRIAVPVSVLQYNHIFTVLVTVLIAHLALRVCRSVLDLLMQKLYAFTLEPLHTFDDVQTFCVIGTVDHLHESSQDVFLCIRFERGVIVGFPVFREQPLRPFHRLLVIYLRTLEDFIFFHTTAFSIREASSAFGIEVAVSCSVVPSYPDPLCAPLSKN